MPAGILWAGLSFTLRDLLHEAFGGCWVLGAIAAGAVLAAGTPALIKSLVYSRLRGWAVLGAGRGLEPGGTGIDSVVFVPTSDYANETRIKLTNWVKRRSTSVSRPRPVAFFR